MSARILLEYNDSLKDSNQTWYRQEVAFTKITGLAAGAPFPTLSSSPTPHDCASLEKRRQKISDFVLFTITIVRHSHATHAWLQVFSKANYLSTWCSFIINSQFYWFSWWVLELISTLIVSPLNKVHNKVYGICTRNLLGQIKERRLFTERTEALKHFTTDRLYTPFPLFTVGSHHCWWITFREDCEFQGLLDWPT